MFPRSAPKVVSIPLTVKMAVHQFTFCKVTGNGNTKAIDSNSAQFYTTETRMTTTTLNSSVFTEVTGDISEAQNLLNRAHEKMKREAKNLRSEREEFEDTRKKLEHVHFAKTVKLNVGGKIYKTSLETLRKDSSSMLAAMFSGRFDVKPDEDDGAYFIDRDGELFRYILNYIRNGELLCSDVEFSEIRVALKAEAHFFQIPSLVDVLSSPLRVFSSSTIIVPQEEKILLSFVSDIMASAKWTLSYRATRDGWEPKAFHQRCDGKSHSLIIARSADCIFGGYADLPWSSPDSETFSPSLNSFLFTLTNPEGTYDKKVLPEPISSQEGSRGGILCFSDKGPTFGSRGYIDLGLMGNSSNWRTGYVNIGQGFVRPHNHHSAYFTGAETFLVEEVEVFTLEN